MDAMSYEYLVRSANNCGRHGVSGANADIYRRLERDYSLYQGSLHEIENNLPRTWGQDINEMNFNVGLRMGEVSTYITTSIKKVQREHENVLTQEQYKELSDCISEIDTPSMDILNDVIDRAGKIMRDIGLYPG